MRNAHAKLLTAFSAGAIFVVGCSSDEQAPIFMPTDSGAVTTGGSPGTGGRATGGRATGGRGGSTGGRSSGGVSGGGAGGANTGGANAGGAGGANTGGANTGGAATGGVGTGGAATGGAGPDAGTGGAATGGTGGTGTGGVGTGGANTGGANTGGANTGGANTGGANTGGAGTGGANTGGASTGGVGTGGAGTGGAGTGGAGTGGAPPVDSGTPHKRVFLTRDTYPGDFTGDAATPFAAADQLCTIAANGASLGGTWQAWLSDDSTNAIDRIADVGPWYRTGDGLLVFANKAAITTSPMVAINRDETGTVVTGFVATHPWTGTNSGGTKAATNCNNWGSTSGTDTTGMCGDATATTTSWTQSSALPCTVPYGLYCFEQ